MPLQLTMTSILTRTRKRADQVGNAALQNSDLQAIVAEVYNQLYTGIAETGHRYFESSQTYAITNGATLSYTMPTDHLGTVRVERQLDISGRCMPLREVGAQEQTYWRGLTGPAYRYAVAGNQLWLLPTPQPSDTYILYYIPQAPDLTLNLGSDLIDLVVPAGARYLINGAAALAASQVGADTAFLEREREAGWQDVIEWSSLRAFTQAPTNFVEDMPEGWPYIWDGGAGWWNRPR